MRTSCVRFLIANLALLLPAIPARAAFVFSVQTPLAATQGSTGNVFDVLLTNTGSSAVTIGSFSFGVTTTNLGISFTDATFATVLDPYIFNGDSLDMNTSNPLNTSLGSELDASDSSFSGNGVSVAP